MSFSEFRRIDLTISIKYSSNKGGNEFFILSSLNFINRFKGNGVIFFKFYLKILNKLIRMKNLPLIF